jgi:hypothetical protein
MKPSGARSRLRERFDCDAVRVFSIGFDGAACGRTQRD